MKKYFVSNKKDKFLFTKFRTKYKMKQHNKQLKQK